MEPIIPNDFVYAGESLKGKEWKEHVVPRALICYECHKMWVFLYRNF